MKKSRKNIIAFVLSLILIVPLLLVGCTKDGEERLKHEQSGYNNLMSGFTNRMNIIKGKLNPTTELYERISYTNYGSPSRGSFILYINRDNALFMEETGIKNYNIIYNGSKEGLYLLNDPKVITTNQIDNYLNEINGAAYAYYGDYHIDLGTGKWTYKPSKYGRQDYISFYKFKSDESPFTEIHGGYFVRNNIGAFGRRLDFTDKNISTSRYEIVDGAVYHFNTLVEVLPNYHVKSFDIKEFVTDVDDDAFAFWRGQEFEEVYVYSEEIARKITNYKDESNLIFKTRKIYIKDDFFVDDKIRNYYIKVNGGAEWDEYNRWSS